MSQRLISSDDHVDMSHHREESFPGARCHDDYDRAAAGYRASMRSMVSNETNQRWSEQQGLSMSGPGQQRGPGVAGRPGHTDAAARLADMDADGVEASSTYCEVSAFRYLYDIKNGWQESTRAFNAALRDFTPAAPDRLAVTFQIPIHDMFIDEPNVVTHARDILGIRCGPRTTRTRWPAGRGPRRSPRRSPRACST
jgi:uncharacterized protein